MRDPPYGFDAIRFDENYAFLMDFYLAQASPMRDSLPGDHELLT